MEEGKDAISSEKSPIGEEGDQDVRKGEMINASGHVQEIDRTFGLSSICAMAIMSDNAWGAGGGSLVVSYVKINRSNLFSGS